MHLRFNFDACPMHSPFGFVHLTHQNLSGRALFCLNSLAKVNTQLLIYNCVIWKPGLTITEGTKCHDLWGPYQLQFRALGSSLLFCHALTCNGNGALSCPFRMACPSKFLFWGLVETFRRIVIRSILYCSPTRSLDSSQFFFIFEYFLPRWVVSMNPGYESYMVSDFE